MAHPAPFPFLTPTGISLFTSFHFLVNLIYIPLLAALGPAPEPFPPLPPSEVHTQLLPRQATATGSPASPRFSLVAPETPLMGPGLAAATTSQF